MSFGLLPRVWGFMSVLFAYLLPRGGEICTSSLILFSAQLMHVRQASVDLFGEDKGVVLVSQG